MRCRGAPVRRPQFFDDQVPGVSVGRSIGQRTSQPASQSTRLRRRGRSPCTSPPSLQFRVSGTPQTPNGFSESRFHDHIARRSGPAIAAGTHTLGPRVLIGPGDDSALIAAVAAGVLLTVDQVIENRHFVGPMFVPSPPGTPGRSGGASPIPGTSVDAVARKAIARSVSDIAAMAGTPAWALATVAFPSTFDQAVAESLFDRMAHWATHFGCPLVGGDVALLPEGDRAAVITVTIGGDPHPARGPVTRAGAKPGDHLYVSGRIGGSFASGRHLSFEPRVAEARWLADTLGTGLHAMIDISDGVGRDGARLARASGVRVQIVDHLVPRHSDAGASALADGEDYELLFAVDPHAPVPHACPITGTAFTRVGEIKPGVGCVLVDSAGGELDAATQGWDHHSPCAPHSKS